MQKTGDRVEWGGGMSTRTQKKQWKGRRAEYRGWVPAAKRPEENRYALPPAHTKQASIRENQQSRAFEVDAIDARATRFVHARACLPQCSTGADGRDLE